MASGGDTLSRFGVTDWFQIGKFLAVLFLLGGFLVSVEAFREIRVPFTGIRLATARREVTTPDRPTDRPVEGAAAR
jgi:hypothetical protein